MWRRPPSASRFQSASSRNSATMAAAYAAGSSASSSTSLPGASPMPSVPTLVVTTGMPAASASQTLPLMPAPKRSGATEMRCASSSGSIAGTSPTTSTSGPASAFTSAVGRKPAIVRRGAGLLGPHERHDLAVQPGDGVRVRLVQEVADEQEPVATRGTRRVVADVVDDADDVHRRRRELGADRIRVVLGHRHEGVGLGVHGELAEARLGRAAGEHRIALQLGVSLLAHVVHVDRVDHDASPRCVPPHELEIALGDVPEAEQREVEVGAGEQLAEIEVRRVDRAAEQQGALGIAGVGLDAQAAQLVGEARPVRRVGRDERDGMALPGEQAQQLEHPPRARGPGVRGEHQVGDEDPAARRAVRGGAQERVLRGRLQAQLLRPACAQRRGRRTRGAAPAAARPGRPRLQPRRCP